MHVAPGMKSLSNTSRTRSRWAACHRHRSIRTTKSIHQGEGLQISSDEPGQIYPKHRRSLAPLRQLPPQERIMEKLALMVGAAVFGLTAGQAMAQMSPADQAFATKAAAGGQAEVSLGQLATKNAASPQVRQFGQQMVADHTQADQELQAIARKQNMMLPEKPDVASQAMEQRL